MKTCKTCNKELFANYPSWLKTMKFCSPKCSYDFRTPKKCLTCKENYLGNMTQKYCKSCPRITGRDFVRAKVRERDKFTCQECGKKWRKGERQLDTHHIDGECGKKSKGYDKMEDMDSLKTFCHKCHYAQHDFGGQTTRRLTDRERRRVIRLREKDLSYRIIGDKVGVSSNGARHIFLNFSR